MHQMTDGWVHSQLDRDECEQAVMDLAHEIGMTPVDEYRHNDTAVGPSGWQMVMESHICFDYINMYLCIDVFSCRPFKHEDVFRFCKTRFKFSRIERDLVMNRGCPSLGE